jgi:hypothetical protein
MLRRVGTSKEQGAEQEIRAADPARAALSCVLYLVSGGRQPEVQFPQALAHLGLFGLSCGDPGARPGFLVIQGTHLEAKP